MFLLKRIFPIAEPVLFRALCWVAAVIVVAVIYLRFRGHSS